MATINSTSGTSFTEIRDAYNNSSDNSAQNDNELRAWTSSSPLSISYFRGAGFIDGSSVPMYGPISIGGTFKESATTGANGKTFSSGIIYNTENWYAHSNWSSYLATPNKLQGLSGYSTYDSVSFANKRVELTQYQSSSYPYTVLLLSNSTTSTDNPGFKVNGEGKIKRSTIWLRREAMNPSHLVQYGLIKKDADKTWTQMKGLLGNKHTTYRDRIAIHSGGYITHPGSASTSYYSTSLTDPVLGTNYITEASTVNIDNRLGVTGGSQATQNLSTSDTVNNSYLWPINNGTTWQYYRYKFDDVDSYLGIDVEYVEFYAEGYITAGSTSSYVTWYSNADFSEMYDGLYVETITGVSIPANTYTSDFTISNRRSYFYKENQSSRTYQTGFTTGYANIKVSGYVARFRWSSKDYMEDTQLGPAYIVLPRTHVINEGNITSSYWLDTDEWTFYVGDTTSGNNNTFKVDIMNDPPGGGNYYKVWGHTGGSNDGLSISWGSTNSPPDSTSWTALSGWANGSDAIASVYWDGTKTVNGWACLNGVISSSYGTGSEYTGALADSEGNTGINAGYLYTEVSNNRHLTTFVFRTEKFNFYDLVSSYRNNLYLKFYVHAYGSDIGNLYVYISHLSTSEKIRSVKLAEYGPNTTNVWSGFTSYNSPWQEKTIDITRYSSRPLLGSDGWYIYFVYENATGYKGDLCLDRIQIVETGMLTKVYQFFDQTSATSVSSEWQPTRSYDISFSNDINSNHQWANGSPAVSGSYWSGSRTVKGWNGIFSSGVTTTTPTSQTGPNESYHGTGNEETQLITATHGYLYTEGDAGAVEMIVRLPGINFYREMLDPISNHVTFTFYYHAYGEHINNRDMRIYIDDNEQSNHTNATLLARYGGEGQLTWRDFSSSTDEWKKNTIYLVNPSNGVKYCDYTYDKTWYIYIVSYNPDSSGYTRSDLGIDYLYFKETSVSPPTSLYEFESHIFTTCNITGKDGPTLSNCRSSYDLTQTPVSNTNWWDNTSFFNVVTQGIQQWTVPKTGTYTIIAEGAEGGRGYADSSSTTFNDGGLGAKISGTFSLTKDDIIYIVVGQKGHEWPNADGGNYTYRPGGGGGGSYVIAASPSEAVTSDILVIAGGGGGAGQSGRGSDGGDAITATTGTNTASAGQGGTGASTSTYSHGGAGFSGNGSSQASPTNFDTYPPKSYKNGSVGGKAEAWHQAHGGFGGGGGAGLSPGGGGGYSGGNASGTWSSTGQGHGGSSYNADTSANAVSLTGYSGGTSGDGKVTIIYGIYIPTGTSGLYSFTTHTFTNCGSTGMYGPTLTECRNTYTPSWTDNTSYFNVGAGYEAGIQQWTVPKTGTYTIDAYGAEGGRGYASSSSTSYNIGGKGVRMQGDFNLTEGDIIWIAVGQKGGEYPDSTYAHRPGAGGGGTFVIAASPSSAGTSDILVIAGGGGGAGQSGRGVAGGDATTSTAISTTGSAGYAGNPSTLYYALSHAGAGFLQNATWGANSTYNSYIGVTPKKYSEGLVGGKPTSWFRGEGGFGGGGGTGLGPGGGGGGYSGGDNVGTWSGTGDTTSKGHGGGSINNGTNTLTGTGHTGHGQVIITFVS